MKRKALMLYPPLKVRSPRFPVKAMLMGVVGRPIHSKGVTVNELRDTIQLTYGLEDTIVNLLDFDITVSYHRGEMVKTDVNCYITFMMAAINRVSQAVWSAYHWILCSYPCYRLI